MIAALLTVLFVVPCQLDIADGSLVIKTLPKGEVVYTFHRAVDEVKNLRCMKYPGRWLDITFRVVR